MDKAIHAIINCIADKFEKSPVGKTISQENFLLIKKNANASFSYMHLKTVQVRNYGKMSHFVTDEFVLYNFISIYRRIN